jgi:hypothetical protein
MNGLDTFRAKDAEAEWMYQRVSKVAANIDPDQAFTVITIPHPS